MNNIFTNTSVFGDGRISTHADPTSTRRNPRVYYCTIKLSATHTTENDALCTIYIYIYMIISQCLNNSDQQGIL